MPNARVTREARQAKAAEMRRQVARKEAQRKTLIASSAVLAVIIVIVAVFVVVQHANRTSAIANGATPANLSSDNSVTVGKSDAKVTMVAYEDFQCPYCEQFETSMSDQLAKWEADGTLKVEYKMIAFLDASSSTDYSTRALNAAAAVNNYDPSAFAAFHKLLYANQPKEGSAGLTDATLVKYAMQATNNQFKTQITTAVKNQTYKGWTQKVTDNMSKNGVNGTPTLIVNGTTLKGFDTTTVTNAIEAAAK